MKKFRQINFRLKTKDLNANFFCWKRAVKKDASNQLDLTKTLNEIKWAGGTVGMIDLSTISDLGQLSERKTDLLQREILNFRTLKNEKISSRNYHQAVELGEKEDLARTQLNKTMAYKIFQRHTCFYFLEDKKIGFVFRGEKQIDSRLESEVRKVFPQMPTYSHNVLSFGLKKLEQREKINVSFLITKLAA